MIKRLHVYFKERYPIIPRILLGIILFLEIHFIILLNMGVTWKEVQLGPAEATGAFTVFAFLLWLRIADDLKDFETDKKLFPDRPARIRLTIPQTIRPPIMDITSTT